VAKQGQKPCGCVKIAMDKKDLGDKVTDKISRDISQEHNIDHEKISKFAKCPDVRFHEL
jgi:hypothetical protein